MSFLQAGQLARRTPTARLDDPLGLVAENLRSSHYGALPVLEGDWSGDEDGAFDDEGIAPRPNAHPVRVLGLIDERDLARALMPAWPNDGANGFIAQDTGHMSTHVAAPAPLPEVPAANIKSKSDATLAATRSKLHLNGFHHENGATNNGSSQNDAFQNGQADSNGADANGADANGVANSLSASDFSSMSAARLATDLKARDVMRSDAGFVPAAWSLHNALVALDRYDCSALPVLDGAGHYKGMISRADVVAALGNYVRPPTVGGMATPLGVWLTTGSLSAGAPPLGLFLSGMALGGCFLFAHITLFLALTYLNPAWGAMYWSGQLGAGGQNAGAPWSATGAFNIAVSLAQSGLFLGAMRLLPMSGVHAAEHQTVWAIERGLPLTPQVVAKMPRAHPRCGTNLVALSGLILIVFQHLPGTDPIYYLTALIFIYFAWRSVGTWLQIHLTTRRASLKQLESGIKAGRDLIAKYQQNPHEMGNFGSRLLNSGIAYSAAGMMLIVWLADWPLEWLFARMGL